MKKNILFLLLSFLILPFYSFACKIVMNVEGLQKSKYKTGEVVIVRIRVEKEHRRCSVDIKDTKITVSGLQIVGATDWVKTDENIWDRKMKVKVLSNKDKKVIISVVRECDRDGGKATLILQTE